jgi:transposase
MTEITRSGRDMSKGVPKGVSTLHGVDGRGRGMLRINLRRWQLLTFFAKLAPIEVVMEACAARTTGRGSWLPWAIVCA